MTNIKKFLIVLAAVAVTSTGAFAEGDPVAERQELMKTVAKNLKGTFGLIKGEYDAAKAEESLKTIAASAEKFATLFPEGSDMSKNPKSEASPDIWKNLDDFKKKAEGLKMAALKAAESAKDGKEALGTAMKDVTPNCGGCHKPYRVKKQ